MALARLEPVLEPSLTDEKPCERFILDALRLTFRLRITPVFWLTRQTVTFLGLLVALASFRKTLDTKIACSSETSTVVIAASKPHRPQKRPTEPAAFQKSGGWF